LPRGGEKGTRAPRGDRKRQEETRKEELRSFQPRQKARALPLQSLSSAFSSSSSPNCLFSPSPARPPRAFATLVVLPYPHGSRNTERGHCYVVSGLVSYQTYVHILPSAGALFPFLPLPSSLFFFFFFFFGGYEGRVSSFSSHEFPLSSTGGLVIARREGHEENSSPRGWGRQELFACFLVLWA
jgi:hypothetical protein